MTVEQAAKEVIDAVAKNLPTVSYQFKLDPQSLGRTPGEQLSEVLNQVDFVEEALVDESIGAQQLEALVAQLHHDIESFWRALALRNGQDYVDMIFQRHDDVMQSDAG